MEQDTSLVGLGVAILKVDYSGSSECYLEVNDLEGSLRSVHSTAKATASSIARCFRLVPVNSL